MSIEGFIRDEDGLKHLDKVDRLSRFGAAELSKWYALEANHVHAIACWVRAQDDGRVALLESTYWSDRAAKRADIWICRTSAFPEQFVEVKLSYLGEGNTSFAGKTIHGVVKTWIHDVERLSHSGRGDVGPVRCAFVLSCRSRDEARLRNLREHLVDIASQASSGDDAWKTSSSYRSLSPDEAIVKFARGASRALSGRVSMAHRPYDEPHVDSRSWIAPILIEWEHEVGALKLG